MDSLVVTINHREYLVGCAEGEQQKVRNLAEKLDKRVIELSTSIGQIGDARLLVIAAIMMQDELDNSEEIYSEPLSDQEGEIANYGQESVGFEDDSDEYAADHIMQANIDLENKLKRAEERILSLHEAIDQASALIESLAQRENDR